MSVSAFDVSADDLGERATVAIDLQVYDKAALFKTAYWFTERAYLYLSPGESDTVVIVEVRPKTTGDAGIIVREFCNSLIDYQTRQFVLRETATVRDALILRAFSEGKAHIDPASIGSVATPSGEAQ